MDLLSDLLKQQPSRHHIIDYPVKDSISVKLKDNVVYIVSGLIFNEKDEILLISEAKQSCYGKWHLPSGRMELGETILEAVIREVEEESGFICHPKHISSVDISDRWFRFNLLCTITGGSLKTKEKADKESIEANWFSIQQVISGDLPLRHKDIIPVIKAGLENKKKHADINSNVADNNVIIPKMFSILPILQSHQSIVTVLVCVHIQDQNISLIVSKDSPYHFPSTNDLNIALSLVKITKELFIDKIDLQNISLLGVEHNGCQGNDGLLLSFMLPFFATGLPGIKDARFNWIGFDHSDIGSSIINTLKGGMLTTVSFL